LIKNFYYNSRSLTPINQLLLTLRFYATGNFLRACDFSGVSISTAFRVIASIHDHCFIISNNRKPHFTDEMWLSMAAFRYLLSVLKIYSARYV